MHSSHLEINQMKYPWHNDNNHGWRVLHWCTLVLHNGFIGKKVSLNMFFLHEIYPFFILFLIKLFFIFCYLMFPVFLALASIVSVYSLSGDMIDKVSHYYCHIIVMSINNRLCIVLFLLLLVSTKLMLTLNLRKSPPLTRACNQTTSSPPKLPLSLSLSNFHFHISSLHIICQTLFIISQHIFFSHNTFLFLNP